jgi:hypothetical protein
LNWRSWSRGREIGKGLRFAGDAAQGIERSRAAAGSVASVNWPASS